MQWTRICRLIIVKVKNLKYRVFYCKVRIDHVLKEIVKSGYYFWCRKKTVKRIGTKGTKRAWTVNGRHSRRNVETSKVTEVLAQRGSDFIASRKLCERASEQADRERVQQTFSVPFTTMTQVFRLPTAPASNDGVVARVLHFRGS